MALMKSKVVPKDAVPMDELEATSYVWDLVQNWTSLSDTWALKYGPFALGAINGISGVLINGHFRRKLKLGTYGYFASVVPISVMPGIMTPLIHRHAVSSQLLLLKNEGCPICYEVRSLVIQLGFGVAYPLLLAPASSLMLANRYSTFRIPSLFEGPIAVFKFVKKITKPYAGTLTTIAIVQFLASSIITHFEMKNNFAIRTKIAEIERKIAAQTGETPQDRSEDS